MQNNQKLAYYLYFKTTNKKALQVYCTFLRKALRNIGCSHALFVFPPKTSLITLLKAPHVYKKAREQFMFSKHKLTLTLYLANPTNILKFLICNKPTEIKLIIKRIT